MTAVKIKGNVGITGYGTGRILVDSVNGTIVELNDGSNSFYAKTVTVRNVGSAGDIQTLVNCNDTQWASLSGQSILVGSGEGFVFRSDGAPPIYSVIVKSVSTDTEVIIGAF